MRTHAGPKGVSTGSPGKMADTGSGVLKAGCVSKRGVWGGVGAAPSFAGQRGGLAAPRRTPNLRRRRRRLSSRCWSSFLSGMGS